MQPDIRLAKFAMKNKLKQKLLFSCVQWGTWSDVAGYVRHQLRTLLGARQAAAIQIHALPHASAEWKGPSATKFKVYSFASIDQREKLFTEDGWSTACTVSCKGGSWRPGGIIMAVTSCE